METKPDPRRKNPRMKAPKGLLVGWKSPSHHAVSHAETIGLGGLYLYTSQPPAQGSMIELLFDSTTGAIRARAAVRRSTPGKGMGVQFVQMGPEERGRLIRFLSKHVNAKPGVAPQPSPVSARGLVVPSTEEETVEYCFESELAQLLAVAKKGTYYQLLGVTSETPVSQIKQSFYAQVRKFHPDLHMGRKELLEPLKVLMGVLAEAYKTLKDEELRTAYDKQLAASGAFNLHRGKTESQETIEDCISRAKECLRVRNFVGSISYLQKCVDMAPNEAQFHAALARSLGMLPQYRNKAVDHFRKAIELDPWNETSYLQCAELYEVMLLPSLADNLYSKLLKINPQHAKAHERHLKISS
jgi:Flp pilus assembly protein TadD